MLRRKWLLKMEIQIGLIMSTKYNEVRNLAKSVKNEPNKNEEKTFKKIVKHK